MSRYFVLLFQCTSTVLKEPDGIIHTYLGPRSSAEHSLRFRDSALAGSDEFSLTPLIFNAYQLLESKQRQVFHVKSGILCLMCWMKTATSLKVTLMNSQGGVMYTCPTE